MFRTSLITAMILFTTSQAHGQRPTVGGLFAYAIDDVLESYDPADERIRIHYSSDGPNAVNLADGNGNATPDYVEVVAEVALEALELYQSTLGLHPPLPEAGFLIGDDGGSNAMDFYLVDFEGSSDGFFGADACGEDLRCTGHMVVENDFHGYAYSSPREGLETVVPHELFHAVQAAYNGSLPSWLSEGSAVWAERAYDVSSRDFLYFANAYLEDTGRSLTKPPAGPVPAFAYGTALFWHFLTERHDDLLMASILASAEGLTSDDAIIDSIAAVLEHEGDTIRAAWPEFAIANLATGNRSGLIDSHPDAERLDGVRAEEEDRTIDDQERFYPLAATYYRIDHPGGALYQSIDEAVSDLIFTLHPVENDAADGAVGPAINTWGGAELGPNLIAEDLNAGGYWLVAANSATSGSSSRIRLCMGTLSLTESCALSRETQEAEVEEEEREPSGGCQQASGSHWLWLILGLGALSRRKRTQHYAR